MQADHAAFRRLMSARQQVPPGPGLGVTGCHADTPGRGRQWNRSGGPGRFLEAWGVSPPAGPIICLKCPPVGHVWCVHPGQLQGVSPPSCMPCAPPKFSARSRRLRGTGRALCRHLCRRHGVRSCGRDRVEKLALQHHARRLQLAICIERAHPRSLNLSPVPADSCLQCATEAAAGLPGCSQASPAVHHPCRYSNPSSRPVRPAPGHQGAGRGDKPGVNELGREDAGPPGLAQTGEVQADERPRQRAEPDVVSRDAPQESHAWLPW